MINLHPRRLESAAPRKRLVLIYCVMLFTACESTENRGADIGTTTETSIAATSVTTASTDCDIEKRACLDALAEICVTTALAEIRGMNCLDIRAGASSPDVYLRIHRFVDAHVIELSLKQGRWRYEESEILAATCDGETDLKPSGHARLEIDLEPSGLARRTHLIADDLTRIQKYECSVTINGTSRSHVVFDLSEEILDMKNDIQLCDDQRQLGLPPGVTCSLPIVWDTIDGVKLKVDGRLNQYSMRMPRNFRGSTTS